LRLPSINFIICFGDDALCADALCADRGDCDDREADRGDCDDREADDNDACDK